MPVCRILVATEADHLVGFATLDPSTGYVDQIVVVPERWSGGIGRTMIESLQTQAERLELRVNQDNARALGFYRRQGFAIIGRAVNEISGAPVLVMGWERGGAAPR